MLPSTPPFAGPMREVNQCVKKPLSADY
jgi:hypothetical protein